MASVHHNQEGQAHVPNAVGCFLKFPASFIPHNLICFKEFQHSSYSPKHQQDLYLAFQPFVSSHSSESLVFLQQAAAATSFTCHMAIMEIGRPSKAILVKKAEPLP
jgi:hypothetical protein